MGWEEGERWSRRGSMVASLEDVRGRGRRGKDGEGEERGRGDAWEEGSRFTTVQALCRCPFDVAGSC